MKKKLIEMQDDMKRERVNWQVRLAQVEAEWDRANDRTYVAKTRNRNVLQDQVDRSRGQSHICVVSNYAILFILTYIHDCLLQQKNVNCRTISRS